MFDFHGPLDNLEKINLDLNSQARRGFNDSFAEMANLLMWEDLHSERWAVIPQILWSLSPDQVVDKKREQSHKAFNLISKPN